ncbi:hypothetical protein GCM10023321_50640 [Pseudonocardia eucalypti]|uniref:Uncharacterized protein n=1 Tax=Pseudonocardia eucalypti TaxID=648755 RepID=A0ABP9QKX7_9PSEU
MTVEASEDAWPRQPPSRTVQSPVVEEPRRCGETAVSRAEVSAYALPPHSVSVVLVQRICESAWLTLTVPAGVAGWPFRPAAWASR